MGLSSSGKTRIEHVEHNGVFLGVIKYFGHWRAYVFYPESSALYDTRCLLNISKHLEDLNRFQRGKV